MKKISPNVFIETGFSGANVGIVQTREGLVMIDTPWRPTDAIKWREEIGNKGKIRYLINTDEHHDHNLCNCFFPGVVIAHKLTREFLLKVPIHELMALVKTIDPAGLPLMKKYQKKLPGITFTEYLNLSLGDHTFNLISLPGHVSGLIGVHIPEEHVVFVSDNVYYKEKTWAHTCTPELWLKSLRLIEQLDADTIVPGHGDAVCGKEYLKEQAMIIQNWVEVVKSAIQQGLDQKNAAAQISCPDPYSLPKIYSSLITESHLNSQIISRLYEVINLHG